MRSGGGWWLRSVRSRVTMTATAAVALALLGAVAGLAYTVQNTLVGRAVDEAEARVAAVAARLSSGLSPGDALSPDDRRVVEVVPAAPPVQILDADGRVIAASGDLVMMRAAPVPSLAEPDAQVVRVGAEDLAIASRSVVVDGDRLNVVAISPLAETARSVALILRTSAIGAPLLLLLVAVVTWRATGRTLRPIEQIRSKVDELSSHTLSQRVPVPNTDDEVAALARTMNTMLERLEDASLRQQAFVSDASHELRSPVAAIRTQLEVALAHPESEDWRSVARGALQDASRMERLISDLLLLAQLDEQQAPELQKISLAECVAEVVQQVGDDRIVVDVPGDLVVCGRATQLAVALRNLVHNAARHSVSRVEVRATTIDEKVEITVSDDGPGVPLQERERIFERFTRLDEGRSRVDGGVGLGLAVAKRVAEHHHGRLTVSDSPHGGASFRLVLPAAPR